jgi:ataxin-10
MDMNWTEILETAKNAKHQFSRDSDAFLNCVESKFHPCYEQFSVYADEMSRKKIDSVLNPASMKQLVLQTRAALRFGLCCLSVEEIQSYSEEIVPAIQSEAIVGYHWCEPLASILTYTRGDKKCRIFAARLLSNLVTSNNQTALIVASSIRIAPSAESISSSILDNVVSSSDPVQVPAPNWVDMILSAAKSRNREAVAAIAAALHNCISSLSMSGHEDSPENHDKNIQFAEEVGSNGILISTLLRHFVSAEAITKALETEKSDSKNGQNNDHWDAATEWIQLLLSRLAKLGMLPKMFSSIDTPSSKNSMQTSLIRLLPEQNILLQCMSREADAYVMECNTDNSVQNPFGGEEGASDTTYAFLAQLLVKMSPWFRDKRLPANTTHQHDGIEQDDFHDQLLRSGFLTVTEILATTLGVDSPLITKLRLYLGQESTILQESAKSLGVVLDDLTEKSVGRKARDIQLTKDDQRLLISLVQFVGNICYGCKHNQDLLRTTLVPLTKQMVPRVEETSECENSTTSSGSNEMRNGLHVLLTCTTHATACFTLREWGVIAIRNVLENNPENQSVVENLMAQGPVESSDLDEAGVRVQLDSKGKVSLSTIDEK